MKSEFKEFMARGNVIDLAVAVILGMAFGRVITSLVNDVLMPPIGLLLGGVDFSNLFIDLSGAGHTSLALAKAAGAPVVAYGLFINTLLDFFIIGLSIFLVVKQYNRLILRRTEPKIVQSVPDSTTEEKLLTEIRDLLRERTSVPMPSETDRVA